MHPLKKFLLDICGDWNKRLPLRASGSQTHTGKNGECGGSWLVSDPARIQEDCDFKKSMKNFIITLLTENIHWLADNGALKT